MSSAPMAEATWLNVTGGVVAPSSQPAVTTPSSPPTRFVVVPTTPPTVPVTRPVTPPSRLALAGGAVPIPVAVTLIDASAAAAPAYRNSRLHLPVRIPLLPRFVLKLLTVGFDHGEGPNGE